MKISFFEEFPTPQNLSKLQLLPFKIKLYLAAKSLPEFQKLSQLITIKYSRYIEKVIYWPILNPSEGYWISPFTNHHALRECLHKLQDKTIPLMLDLELPFTQNPLLFLTQLSHFKKNKNLIQHFCKVYRGEVYLCEYPLSSGFCIRLLKLVGLHYSNPKLKIMKMYYRSLHHISNKSFQIHITKNNKQYPGRFIGGLGTIATGIHQTEQILTEAELERDLHILQNQNITEAVIFRLGGITKKHLPILKKYHSSNSF